MGVSIIKLYYNIFIIFYYIYNIYYLFIFILLISIIFFIVGILYDYSYFPAINNDTILIIFNYFYYF